MPRRTALRLTTTIVYPMGFRMAILARRSRARQAQPASRGAPRGYQAAEPLGWVRARLRPIATLTLASLAALGGLSSAVHDASDCHDDECRTVLLRHDPSSHAIGAPKADADHPLHCVLCHWTRTLRPSTEAVHEIARPVAHDVRIPLDLSGAPRHVLQAQPPLRSPPIPAVI